MEHLIRLLERNTHIFTENDEVLLLGSYDSSLLKWFNDFGEEEEMAFGVLSSNMQTYNRAKVLFDSPHNYLFWNSAYIENVIDTNIKEPAYSDFNVQALEEVISKPEDFSGVFKIGGESISTLQRYHAEITYLKPKVILTLLPKNKGELFYLVMQVEEIMAYSQHLGLEVPQFYLIGDNDHGIKSISKFFTNHTTVIDSAGHGRILKINVTDSVYSIIDEKEKEKNSKILFNYLPTSQLYLTVPGTFSAGSMDKGSLTLYQSFTDPNLEENRQVIKRMSNIEKPYKVLDYAAGAGALTLTIGGEILNDWWHEHNHLADKGFDLEFTLIESDLSSLRNAELNLAVNNMQENATLIAATSIKEAIEDLKPMFDLVIANPPFHEGKKVDYEITHRFIKEAKSVLCKNGTIRIVANRMLPYREIINQEFKQVTEINLNSEYIVYNCVKS